nr:ribonuclease H-like domain-containing protein [Tanacetum cinerariifolium]
MAPRAVLIKTGLRPFSTVRPVNTAHPKTTFYRARRVSQQFQQPEFKIYGPKTSKSVSENISNELKESPDALLVKEAKQQEKPVRKPVKYAEMYRPRPVNTAWPRPINIARPRLVNTVRPNLAVVNAVRVNQVNAIKASACWLWRPTKPNGALITLKRHNYIDGHSQKEDQGYVDSGCSRHMTGNMFYLSDFKEFDGVYVTFREGDKRGRITSKGTLKNGKLDFEDLYVSRS